LKIRNFTIALPNHSDEILKAGSIQLPYFRTKEFSEMIDYIKANLLGLLNCDGGKIILLASSGTGAMESIVTNLASNEKVMILNGGSFGERWSNIYKHYFNNKYCNYRLERGKDIDLKKLIDKIKQFKPTMILMQATETSTGQKYNLKEIGKICKEFDIKLIVDAIAAFCLDEYDVDRWDIYASVISSQKGLSLPPGLGVICLSNKVKLKKSKSFYFDYSKYLRGIGEMWCPFTPVVYILYQLNIELQKIVEMGLKNRIKEVYNKAIYFRNKIKNLPLKIVAETPSNSISVLKIDKKDSKNLFNYLKLKNMYITPRQNNLVDVTHTGYLLNEDYDLLVGRIKEWLKK